MRTRWKLAIFTAAALAACTDPPGATGLFELPSGSGGGEGGAAEERAAEDGAAQATAEDGGSIPLPGQIGKLVADPRGGVIYALNRGTPSQVIIIDTKSRTEVGRVTLAQPATDLDISPNGAYLVVSHDAAHAISVVNAAARSVSTTVFTQSDPYCVEVGSSGTAYYIELDQWTSIRRVGLPGGADTLLGSWSVYRGDAELSADGAFLYVGESGISGGALIKYNVAGGGLVPVDESNYDDGYGFPYPQRHVYLAPGGRHIYYAGYQLDAGSLGTLRGRTGEQIFAEDAAGTIAIGSSHIFDAELVRPVASLPRTASAAVLVGEANELWYYSSSTGRLYYTNPYTLFRSDGLGRREVEPGPLASYSFTELVHDPVRPRLYGLDAAKGAVVVIDAVTLQPTRVILVGSTPTDLDIDSSGTTLFVGHLDVLGFARIDLATLTFESFVTSPRNTYRIEAVSGGRVVTIDDDQWTTPTLADAVTGQVLAQRSWAVYQGALSATADGATVFVGESSLSGSNVIRYSVATGQLVKIDESDYDGGYGFPYPQRSTVALPDGSGVYYAGYLLDGNDLSILRYPLAGPILAVTPDGRLALSASAVYSVATGTSRGPLPVAAAGRALAISPDGRKAFIGAGGSIAAVDLTAY
jgi:hypothetical protein